MKVRKRKNKTSNTVTTCNLKQVLLRMDMLRRKPTEFQGIQTKPWQLLMYKLTSQHLKLETTIKQYKSLNRLAKMKFGCVKPNKSVWSILSASMLTR